MLSLRWLGRYQHWGKHWGWTIRAISHRILLDQIQRPVNVGFLLVEAASQREQLGRVVDAMRPKIIMADELKPL
jgi:hypothetical protein